MAVDTLRCSGEAWASRGRQRASGHGSEPNPAPALDSSYGAAGALQQLGEMEMELAGIQLLLAALSSEADEGGWGEDEGLAESEGTACLPVGAVDGPRATAARDRSAVHIQGGDGDGGGGGVSCAGRAAAPAPAPADSCSTVAGDGRVLDSRGVGAAWASSAGDRAYDSWESEGSEDGALDAEEERCLALAEGFERGGAAVFNQKRGGACTRSKRGPAHKLDRTIRRGLRRNGVHHTRLAKIPEHCRKRVKGQTLRFSSKPDRRADRKSSHHPWASGCSHDGADVLVVGRHASRRSAPHRSKPAAVARLDTLALHAAALPAGGRQDPLQRLLAELQHRDITPEDYDLLLRLDESVKPKTCPAEFVEALPVVEVSATTDHVCMICLDILQDGEQAKALKCQHIFHPECLTQWLTHHSRNCPVDGLPVFQA